MHFFFFCLTNSHIMDDNHSYMSKHQHSLWVWQYTAVQIGWQSLRFIAHNGINEKPKIPMHSGSSKYSKSPRRSTNHTIGKGVKKIKRIYFLPDLQQGIANNPEDIENHDKILMRRTREFTFKYHSEHSPSQLTKSHPHWPEPHRF